MAAWSSKSTAMWQRIATIFVVTHLVTAQECIHGELRTIPVTNSGSSTHTDIPQYCSNGEWMMFCTSGAATYTQEMLNMMCRHLGYSDQGASKQTGGCSVALTADFVRPSTTCTGAEQTIQGCPLETLESCSCNNIVRLECQPDTVAVVLAGNGEIRLFGGSSNQEGTVQVHRDGRWETVCANSQEGIAGAVCSQVGFSAEGVIQGSFAPTTPPNINCTIQSGTDTLQCTNASCDHLSPSLEVVCKSHQEVVNTLVNETFTCNRMISQQRDKLEECNIQRERMQSVQSQYNVTIAVLGAIIGLLGIVSLITTVGWIVTCSKPSGQKVAEIETEVMISNESYTVHKRVHEDTDAYAVVNQTAATTGGETTTDNHNYEVITETQ